MKNLLGIILVFIYSMAAGQDIYWQQQVNVNITVSLNDADHTLDGSETITYINHSPDTLRFIWFHLWPNAYKNDRTAFSEGLIKGGRTDFYFSTPEQKGYINRLAFKADGVPADTENDSANIDIIKLLLPKPLAPGAQTIISTPFHVQLPYNFSRGGHVGNDYQVTQWFPKPAVYDREGWHPMPYLDQGEFYSEFGNFDVTITAANAYQVAATGHLQDAEMLAQIRQTGVYQSSAATNTWRYVQTNVHDFAWFAGKAHKAHFDTTLLPSGKLIEIFSWYTPADSAWAKSIGYIKDGLHYYSRRLGDYPYDVVSVVKGPPNVSSGGMEYPTITLITTNEDGRELDATIVHEVGHNWFYGALGSNERRYPWMDEGMNTYYQQQYENTKYGQSALAAATGKFAEKLPDNETETLLQTMEKLHKDQSISSAADSFSNINYGLIIYHKAAKWMQQLELHLSTPLFDSAMKQYYAAWKNKHPYPADFRASMERATAANLSVPFAQLDTTGPLVPLAIKKPLKLSFLFNLKETDKYNYINIAPIIGFNNYDKIMPGLVLHNYQLPLNKFRVLAAAMYGTGSKKVNSFGRASYNITQRRFDFETALSFANYSKDEFTYLQNPTVFPRVARVVPSAKLTLYDGDPAYMRRFTVQWKTFLLKEDDLNFSTEITPANDTIERVSLQGRNTVINRLALQYSDKRVLYPYSVNLTADQGKNFIRAGLTAEYFFNYPENKTGLTARFFAGRFFYLGDRNEADFNFPRYFLKLSAPNGNEDYSYSDYFVGRNEYMGSLDYVGWQSQQIMQRDGFFKVNTALNSSNIQIGNSDDWIMALNLSTDLPDDINPLRVLPIKIPLKIFVDIGTYAEAWKVNPASGRFVYDAGVQIPLFASLVNIYIPILYSKVYSNYYKSTIYEKRFLKTISFSIDIQKLKADKLLKNFPL